MQNPQPVNPELTCWPVTGMLDMLNNFRGERQPFGDRVSSLVVLGKEASFIVILFFLS